MTDVPCHSWILPTLLKHAGVDFLHLGCNSACSSPDIPFLFWWEGPDGSRLLTMYEAGGYGSGILPPKDWPHRTWLGLIHTGDNHGPPKPDEVNKLLEKARKELPGVKVRMGRLSDFADAILAEKPKLPVIRADMPDTWIHGIMSMPTEAQSALQAGALDAVLLYSPRTARIYADLVLAEADALIAAVRRLNHLCLSPAVAAAVSSLKLDSGRVLVAAAPRQDALLECLGEGTPAGSASP